MTLPPPAHPPQPTSASDPTPTDAERFAAAYPPLAYHRLHLAGERAWWRGLIGVAVTALCFLVVVPLLVLIAFLMIMAVVGADGGWDELTGLDTLTPWSLAYLLTALGMMIPVIWAVTRLQGLKPRWVSSIAPRLRWSYLCACVGVALVAMIAGIVASLLLGVVAGTSAEVDPAVETEFALVSFTTTVRDFLIVILLVTPFQAAAEEYVFRGYLTQLAGGIFANETVAKVLAVLVPATLFAVAHGQQDIPLFFDRFAFGLMAGVLVILTGGLEAPIAMHVLNNWFAFGIALAFGQMDEALSATSSSWWAVPVTIVRTGTFLVGAVLVHRWMGLKDRADSAVLITSRGRVYGFASAP